MASVTYKCQWCLAINCSNSRNKRPDLSFFCFPKDKDWQVVNLIPAWEGRYFSAQVDLNFQLSYACLEYHEMNNVFLYLFHK